MDYEKILESLKICSEVGTSCEGCSGRGERHCIANPTKAAAIAIETLLHALDMAKRERDVVTKRMIELDQENVTNRNGLNEPLTLDELRQMDGEPVWWWNKSAKPVCTICVWDRFMNEPMFANYDWQSEDTLKLSKYKWLKKCGYKPYRQKPEEDT